MIEAVVALDGLGNHIEAGVVGKQEVLSGLVQRQEAGAGSSRVNAAELGQCAGFFIYRKCINKSAAALGEIGVFVQLVGDVENVLFRIDGGAVAGKVIVLFA